jgi:ferredoxin-type protein NapH
MIRIKWLRIGTATVALIVMLWGATCKAGVGTVCALNIGGVPFSCPLGYLEAALASRNLLLQLWLGVALVLLSVVLFGRFFCAWLCPTALLRQLFGTRPAQVLPINRQNNNPSVLNGQSSAVFAANGDEHGKPWSSYSGLAVLGGALASSFLFGFPVFCLVCPIGLFYGSLFAVSRLVFANQPSAELIVLPLILGLELFGLRRWCSSICPLGALLGLLARFNHTFRLRVDQEKCLATRGIQCRACEKACLYGFNISKEKSNPIVNACAKCFECYENCPTKAIRLRLVK